MISLLSADLGAYKTQIEEVVRQLHDLTIRIGHDELSSTLGELRNRIQEPFMFVIVGEVKVGKSSFVNALLESQEEICKVAPSPMTDTIQQIVYGKQSSIVEINPYLKRITEPIDILKEIAIVDTPGTNTIIEHHQEITENFIPSSDLIVFVFEAKNPYRQSAWDFFKYIKSDWHKKVIFVLQQKDLMDVDDLKINEKGLYDFAEKNGISDPKIFSVSAKMELDGNKAESGFIPLRDFIHKNITGGQAPILKQLNNITTSHRINEMLLEALSIRKKQLESDLHFRNDIKETLDKQESVSKKQIEVLTENLVAGYDQITRQKEEEIKSQLGLLNVLKRSFISIFDKEQSIKTWLEGLSGRLEDDLNKTLRKKLDAGVGDLSDSIQQMAQIVGLKIKNSETILKNDHEVFSDIAEKRANVLKELQEAFSSFLNNSENFYSKELFAEQNRLAPNVATGTGVAILGAMLTALTNGMVFDITGGILTAVGLLFASVSLGFNKRKIVSKYRDEIEKGRIRLDQEVSEKLSHYVEYIKSKIDQNFFKLDNHLESEKKEIGDLNTQHVEISERLNDLKEKIVSKTGINENEI